MPVYHRLGEVPRKRHTVVRNGSGGLIYEELIGNKGFAGASSLLYHLGRPTAFLDERLVGDATPEAEAPGPLRPRHFRLGRMETGGSPTLDRRAVAFNGDLTIAFATPREADPFFYRNGQADELLFVADGGGRLESTMGGLDYRRGDYIVIPRGIVHRLVPDGSPHRLLVVESPGAIRTPKRYRNEFGQLLEHSPFCERDIRRPDRLDVHAVSGRFDILHKQADRLTMATLDHHPFDVVAFDGYYYPWAFNIEDFEPIVGRIHQPPPVHQTFEGDGFVICSFVPRLYDFHPEAVPAPYHHANAMSDEVLFYAKDRFMSRKGIEYASMTLHPDGLTHGPHPGRAEASIGQAETDELAVMIDTFRPLAVARPALAVEDEGYPRSWLERA